ncbi:MAG: flagellar biosynthesis protein FlhF [Bermanella sp.]|jgi:flagellar biosynthesis protein FlhF
MKFLTFFGSDSSQAMRQVSEELGDDASILSCRRVKGGVELIVSVDDSAVSASPKAQSEPTPKYSAASPAPVRRPTLETVASQSSELLQLKKELHATRSMLEDGIKDQDWVIQSAKNPSSSIALQICEALDVDVRLATALANRIPAGESPEVQREMLRSLLRRQLKTLPTPREGVTALVGPPGAGKTSTIAKIAAEFIRTGRRDDIALITTDNTRIAAQEQLRVYGDIFQIPVHAANSADEAARLLKILGSKQYVLLDTAGIGFRDSEGLDNLGSFIASLPDIDVFLTLPADREAYVIEEIIEAYSQLPISGVIATHLDEAVRIGALVSMLIKNQLPTVWLSDGAKVPGDLHAASPADLINRTFLLAREFKKRQRSSALDRSNKAARQPIRGQRA